MKTADLTRVSLLLALLIVSAQLAIPIGPVAISLQTLVVLIIGFILPTRQAILTTSLYLVVGLIGVPVFAQAMGGPQSILLPSFGFILSFLPAVWVISKIRQLPSRDKISNYLLAVFFAHLIIYAIGLSYMTFILNVYLGNAMSFGRIFTIGMLPFIPGDIVKSVVAVSIAKRLSTYLSIRSE